MMMIILLVTGLLASSVDSAINKWETPAITGAKGTYVHPTAIPENTANTETILLVKAVDGTDTALTFVYSITKQTTVDAFEITTAGILSVKTALDYETVQTHTIEVEAKTADEMNPSATAIITFNVGNVGPEFTQPLYTACANQESSAGTVITTLSATIEGGGDITYSITSIDPETDIFGIDGANVIVAAGKSLTDIQLYKLTIDATYDNEPPASTELEIDVKAECSSASMMSPLSFVLLLVALVVSMD